MKVCLICSELFGHGVYGGFGRMTRKLGCELANRNVEVTAVVPRREGSRVRDYVVDGLQVREFPRTAFLTAMDLFRQLDADVFHSQDPSLGTWLAMKAMPGRAHVVTFRDPMEAADWHIEFNHAGPARLATLAYLLYADNFLVTRAIHRATGLYGAAQFVISKAARKYGLRQHPGFLPTPIDIPPPGTKAAKPTVCFVARLHRRKRPELFLDLVRQFPKVRFICVGGTNETVYEDSLRRSYADLPNLEMTGTIDQFQTDRLQRILEQSWVLVNTAVREGLPTTFLEAAANRCAILSSVDPDGFATRFGYHAKGDGDLPRGLSLLLTDNRWRSLGESGAEYVRSVFATDRALDRHMETYRLALDAVGSRKIRPIRRGIEA
jgi:glycosyltransferase involved in cell wall biosynthesis